MLQEPKILPQILQVEMSTSTVLARLALPRTRAVIAPRWQLRAAGYTK